MSTATRIPATRGELEGDEAFETLRRTGRKQLIVDSAIRFRAADGFSHSRALAFQFTLTLVPALIALVGLAAAADQDNVRRVVESFVEDIAPGAVADILTEALRQGSNSAAQDSGENALVGGLIASLVSGTTAMAQIERGANRIYGVERDRPFLRKYANGLLLAVTAGASALLAVALLVGGAAIRDSIGFGDTVADIWSVLRWPLGVAFAITAVALLFERAPRRRQPEASWLAFGAGASSVLWLASMGVLYLFIDVTESFGATYGPLAGTIALLLWTFFTAFALFGGLALAAQLEAVRAGVPEPRNPLPDEPED